MVVCWFDIIYSVLTITEYNECWSNIQCFDVLHCSWCAMFRKTLKTWCGENTVGLRNENVYRLLDPFIGSSAEYILDTSGYLLPLGLSLQTWLAFTQWQHITTQDGFKVCDQDGLPHGMAVALMYSYIFEEYYISYSVCVRRLQSYTVTP